ncbi:type II secretion system protein GspL [Pseudomonas sp. GD04158]|uniref:type II secretion system protein GspL n=1 Tax=Pseudomonadaceae TaxID=135621 RepID=UPI00244C7874|nr:type II secretion system protein GspL [Pseudomonas sp. GD04158]MDH0098400.1 type II secretion system protein GspL [Pseudomonas sp. GD04158]
MNQSWIFLPPEACHALSLELAVQRVTPEQSQALSLAEALRELPASWELVLPVEAVTTCAVQLPTQKARWLRQALPFAVEELLAEDVELMHLALGEKMADGRHRVYALRADWLRECLALCAAQPPQAIRVDADLLPQQGSQLLWLGSRWLLGGEVPWRLALQTENWSALAGRCPSPRIASAPAGQALPEPVDEVHLLEQPHQWLVRQGAGVDLAQGEFAQVQAGAGWQRWRPLAGVVALCLLLQWGFNLAQGWYLQREADAYAASSEALYRQLFPEDRNLINLRAQFDQHLAQTGGGDSLVLELLAEVADALHADGAPQVQINQLDYSAIRADMALQIQAPGFAELERLRERLEQAGQAVQMGSASREADGVSARLVIGG